MLPARRRGSVRGASRCEAFPASEVASGRGRHDRCARHVSVHPHLADRGWVAVRRGRGRGRRRSVRRPGVRARDKPRRGVPLFAALAGCGHPGGGRGARSEERAQPVVQSAIAGARRPPVRGWTPPARHGAADLRERGEGKYPSRWAERSERRPPSRACSPLLSHDPGTAQPYGR
eukprot:scaffold15771_cov27-Tisochrysis_lutea.AAC.6